MPIRPTFPYKPYGSRNQEIVASKKRAAALARVFKHESGNAIVIALDDRSISGPHCDGLLHITDTVKRAINSQADAVLGHPGLFTQHGEIVSSNLAGIVNITLSTAGPDHLNKVLIASPASACGLGIGCISIHVNTTSENESDMLQILGLEGEKARAMGLIVLAHMYPRTHNEDGSEYHYQDLKVSDPEKFTKLVMHGVTLATDLNADIIKVPYTGSRESFAKVVAAADGRKVLMAGGSSKNLHEFLTDVSEAMAAGASGVALGRNFFERIEKGDFVLAALDRIVHYGMSVEEALVFARLETKSPNDPLPSKAVKASMKSKPFQLGP